jgi:SecD/SecF fusion protein
MAALIVFAAVLLMPSFYSNTPHWFKKYVYQEGLKLGLDLQGGMHLILRVDVDQAVKNAADLSARDLQDSLKHKQITIVRRKSPGNDEILFAVPNRNAVEQIKNILAEDFPNLEIREVRENGRFPMLVLKLSPEEEKFIRENAVDQSLEIIRNRIDQFGVSEPVIVRQGEDEIVVQLPGVKDPKRALKLIGQTAQLEFKLVDSDAGVDAASLIRRAVDEGRIPAGADVKIINSVLKGQLPRGDAIYFMKEQDSRTGRIKKSPMVVYYVALRTISSAG